MTIPASDIQQQYRQYQVEFDLALAEVLQSGQFIGGPAVSSFEEQLAGYLNMHHVVACANGTDALQLALLSLNLPKGSKIMVPAFTYIAPVEVIRFLGYEPVYCDVDAETFNCTTDTIQRSFTPGIRALLPVHLFGQCCEMNSISTWAEENNCAVIEDNAQSIAAEKDTGNCRSIITTSFFPTKNLSCFGDGGAVITNDAALAVKIRRLANHGQSDKKYMHESLGINSRLDAIQAAVLLVKLKHLDTFIAKRQMVATFYDNALGNLEAIRIPKNKGQHTYHQYTLQVEEDYRDGLQQYLAGKGIPTSIYYPIPAYRQQAYLDKSLHLPNTETLCSTVLSLPIHTALDEPSLSYICENIQSFFK